MKTEELNKIKLSIEELAAVIIAGRLKLREHAATQATSEQYYALTQEDIKALVQKLDERASTFYLGAVNAGFILGFASMQDEFPLDNLWQDLCKCREFAELKDDTSAAGDAYRKLVAFLQQANLIKA